MAVQKSYVIKPIVMLTDEDGNIAERRHFDPWGQPIKVEDGAGNTLDKLTLLDRGFTGHEHFQTAYERTVVRPCATPFLTTR